MYTFKVMIHPNNKQRTKILRTMNKCIECQNIIYDILDGYIKNNKTIPSCFDIRKMFTIIKKEKDDEVIKLRECMTKKDMIKNHLDTLFCDVSNDALKQTVKDTYKSFVRYFNKLGKYPNRKSYKDRKKSFYVDPFKIDITSNKVKLEKIANNLKSNRKVLNWIKLAEKNRIPQGVSYYNPRISFDGTNFYLTVGVTDNNAPIKNIAKSDDRVIGIDLNNAEIVTSENTRYKQATKTKEYKRIKNRRKRLQRALSRKYLAYNSDNKKKVKYSQNYKKNKSLIKRLDKRLMNIRDDCHNKIITHILLKPPKIIVLEDLYISEMSNKEKRDKMTYEQKLASKNIVEASLRKFRMLLQDRVRRYETIVMIASKYYPSTKKCMRCGNVKEMKINDRIYNCDCCGLIIDRDYNAAINLANYVK
jgi:putative transposase